MSYSPDIPDKSLGGKFHPSIRTNGGRPLVLVRPAGLSCSQCAVGEMYVIHEAPATIQPDTNLHCDRCDAAATVRTATIRPRPASRGMPAVGGAQQPQPFGTPAAVWRAQLAQQGTPQADSPGAAPAATAAAAALGAGAPPAAPRLPYGDPP